MMNPPKKIYIKDPEQYMNTFSIEKYSQSAIEYTLSPPWTKELPKVSGDYHVYLNTYFHGIMPVSISSDGVSIYADGKFLKVNENKCWFSGPITPKTPPIEKGES